MLHPTSGSSYELARVKLNAKELGFDSDTGAGHT
jgi:hypothetical protein